MTLKEIQNKEAYDKLMQDLLNNDEEMFENLEENGRFGSASLSFTGISGPLLK